MKPLARDIVDEIKERFLVQFSGAPVIEGINKAFGVQLQDLQNAIFQLFDILSIDGNEGVNLDRIGTLVGQLRNGKSDAEYRRFLKARVKINKSNGTIPKILEILALTHPSETFSVREPKGGVLIFNMLETWIGVDLTELMGILREIKGGGTRVELVYNRGGQDNDFLFADGDTVQTDVNHGFSNDAGTTGGYLSGIKV